MSSRITLRRALVGAGLGVILAVGVPLAASAHVTVNPGTADPGSYTQVQFRVPNESETAKTVRLEVTLPSDTPFTSVRYEPVPGWTATITTSTLPQPVEVGGNTITEAPTSIVWQADPGGGIGQGQFLNLPVSLGPVPDVGSVLLPAVQTYDDGTVAEWTATPEEVAADDTLEPAPVMYITDAPPAHEHSSHGAGASAGTSGSSDEMTMTTDAAATADSSSGLALGLSIAALVLGAGGAVLGALAFARRPKARS